MKKLLLAGAAVLGLVVSAGSANATLTYTIWNGTGLNHNAVFPLPGSTPLVSFTSTVDTLNFVDNAPFQTIPTFSVFDNGQGILSAHMSAAQLALPMSTLDGSSTTISTLFEITESYNLASPLLVTLTHDDGAGIYLDGSTTPIAGCNSTSEAAQSTQTCTLPAGPHSLTLLYAEDNTAPAILQIALPPEITAAPEPASLALLGSALAGLGVFMRRRRNA